MTFAISQEYTFELLQSKDPFPVDFDMAWSWIGYVKKQSAKNKLIKNFVKGADFLPTCIKSPTGGRSSEQFLLTIDCFKQLAMMAGTERGREVREHFIECERKLKVLSKDGTRPVTTKLTMSMFDRILSGEPSVPATPSNKPDVKLRLLEAANKFLTDHPHDRDILMLILKEA